MGSLRKLKQPLDCTRGYLILGRSGFSLLEVLIVVGIMGVIMLAMMTMQANQIKANSYLEYQVKRSQLHSALIGQVFNDKDNCACLFAGASPFAADPASPGATLTNVNPTKIGRYDFVTSGNCSTATMPQPLVDNVGIDGMKTTSIQLTNILQSSGTYTGEVVVKLQSLKAVLGPQDLQIRIPVIVNTTPSGSNVAFSSCALATSNDDSMGLEGTAVGSAISEYFTTANTTRNNTYQIADYPDAKAIHYDCDVSFRESDGEAYVKVEFKNGSTSMYVDTFCNATDIGDVYVAHDRRTGTILIPSEATQFAVQRGIGDCKGGCKNQSSLQLMK